MKDITEDMEHLKEKIELTTENGSWSEVDTQEFMDEVRGRDDS